MFNIKLVFFCSCVIGMVISNNGSQILNGGDPLSGEGLQEAVAMLENSLAKLPPLTRTNYKISKVNHATFQLSDGNVYEYDVDFIDGENNVRNCIVSHWSQPAFRVDDEIIVKCNGEEVLQRFSV